MTALQIIDIIYASLISNKSKNGIPIHLSGQARIATIQDDPFDIWIGEEIKVALPAHFEVFHSGSLTTPDIIIRDKNSGALVGLEIKTLIQKINGSDSRGLTLDYNSSLPCGSAMIKLGRDTVIIPCFYVFALLDNSSRYIVTLIIMDGDFLNYDFDLYKEAKYANYTEYGHGPYAEGSVRHRRMYTYPNPLNSKLADFHMKMVLVAKKSDFDVSKITANISGQVVRSDRQGNDFYYYIKDMSGSSKQLPGEFFTIRDIFVNCKVRAPKERTAAMPSIPPMG